MSEQPDRYDFEYCISVEHGCDICLNELTDEQIRLIRQKGTFIVTTKNGTKFTEIVTGVWKNGTQIYGKK